MAAWRDNQRAKLAIANSSYESRFQLMRIVRFDRVVVINEFQPSAVPVTLPNRQAKGGRTSAEAEQLVAETLA